MGWSSRPKLAATSYKIESQLKIKIRGGFFEELPTF